MKKTAYAWAICLIGLLVVVCNMGLCLQSISVSLPFIKAQGFSGTQCSALISIRCLFSLLGMTVVNWFYDRVSIRQGMTLACLITASAFVIESRATSIISYYIAVAMLGIGYSFGATIPVSLLINRCFSKNRAFAISICMSGSGLTTVLFAPIMYRLMGLDLSRSFLLLAAVSFVIALLGYTALRKAAEENDLALFNRNEKQDERSPEKHVADPADMTVWQYAVMLLVVFAICGATLGAGGHTTLWYNSIGYSPTQIPLAISLSGIALTLGTFTYGRAADRFGRMKSTMAYMWLWVIGCFLCIMAKAQIPLIMYLAAALMGFGAPPSSVGITIWTNEFTSRKNYPQTLKWFEVMHAGGGLIISAVPGIIFDKTGSYLTAYQLFLGMMAVSAIAMLLIHVKRVRAASQHAFQL